MIIETERLLLRPFQPGDEADLFAYLNGPLPHCFDCMHLDELEQAGFVDTFRLFDEGENNFTWWSYRTRARERNAGWRLDYFYVNEEIRDNVKSAEILDEIYGSDHCPVTLELDFNKGGIDDEY